MYCSLIASLLLGVQLGLAAPAPEAHHHGRSALHHPALHQHQGSTIRSSNSTSSSSSLSSSTVKTFDTVNGFTDPVVHCSGRSLSDSGDSDYTADLDTAVTSTSEDGLYGACDVNGGTVDGDGALAWSSGTVQVYYCNHAFSATSCDINEYWRADALITDKCGADGGGWVTVSALDITIGRDPTNSDGSFRSECGYSLHGLAENIVMLNLTASA
ncbi:hypothetical protein BD289DRAFT_451676 [Coniella lustricola]|uniref:Cyanovirin-N domain-containing protein n=1 Tax=Coniella lustricola TaxID=2025994 RepID=A0A2T3AE33_9PEZI|nr:hypothetical protein BD289DRAFT_451676 [Coniella lustricola]